MASDGFGYTLIGNGLLLVLAVAFSQWARWTKRVKWALTPLYNWAYGISGVVCIVAGGLGLLSFFHSFMFEDSRAIKATTVGSYYSVYLSTLVFVHGHDSGTRALIFSVCTLLAILVLWAVFGLLPLAWSTEFVTAMGVVPYIDVTLTST